MDPRIENLRQIESMWSFISPDDLVAAGIRSACQIALAAYWEAENPDSDGIAAMCRRIQEFLAAPIPTLDEVERAGLHEDFVAAERWKLREILAMFDLEGENSEI